MLDAPAKTPPEIAKRLKVKPETVITWIRSGRLQALNVASPGCRRPRYRVTPEALEAFERSLSVTPPPKTQRRTTQRTRRYFQ